MQTVFETYLKSVDAKESTRNTYRKALECFSHWMEEKGLTIPELMHSDIVSYKDYLLSSNKSALTVNLYLSTLRGFFKWADGEDICKNIANGVGSVRTNKETFRRMHLENEQGAQLLDQALTAKEVAGANDGLTRKLNSNERAIALRNYAMINLMLRTGLRTIEVSRADVGDITFKRDRRILKVWGKGRIEKDSFVVLTDPAYLPIKEYLDNIRPYAKAAEPLFAGIGLGHNGNRLSTRSIQNICKETLREIGLEGHEYSAHSLRHTTGTQILLNGGTMMDVQNVLRHASPATSQLYVNTIMEDKRLDDASERILDNSFKMQ